MTATLDPSRRAAEQQQRKVQRIMRVTVGHPGTVDECQVVEQRAIAVRCRSQLVQVIREKTDMKMVDLGNLRNLLGIVLVMGRWMMRVGYSDFGIGAPAELSPKHERHH